MLTCAPMFKVWESEHAFGRFLFLSRFRHWRRPSSTVAGNNASKLATAASIRAVPNAQGALYRAPCVTLKIVTAPARIISHTRISLVVVIRGAFFTDSRF